MFSEASNSGFIEDLDYGDESGSAGSSSSDDKIDMHKITFKMPDEFEDSKYYLYKIWEMMELEHRDIKKQRMYRIEQQIEGEDFTSTFH